MLESKVGVNKKSTTFTFVSNTPFTSSSKNISIFIKSESVLNVFIDTSGPPKF